MKQRKNKTNDLVYIVLDNEEVKVNNDNGMATQLIKLTDMSIPKRDRVSMLNIRGLGLLKYRTRKILRRQGSKGLLYRLKFDQCNKI